MKKEKNAHVVKLMKGGGEISAPRRVATVILQQLEIVSSGIPGYANRFVARIDGSGTRH